MGKKAAIYRMVTPDHLCPWGVKAIDLLRRSGYDVEDHHLASMEANKAYKSENGYDETPQIFIDGAHLGGYDALREHLGKGPDPKEGETYQPILAVFSITLLASLALTWGHGNWVLVLERFIALSMCVLGILKLQDLQSYATGFVQYDLLAQRYVPYAYFYAFIEAIGGVLMLGHLLVGFVAPLVFIAASIGAVSVFKAVYVEKRDLNCACVGGGSRVPLGFLSLTENLMMMAMSVWMLVKINL